MWLPAEIETIFPEGLEQFEPDPAGQSALPGSWSYEEIQWIIWSEASGEVEWAAHELGFLAAG